MKLTIESTEKITDIDGVPVRYWTGVAEDGTRCHVFIHRIAVHKDDDCSKFGRHLTEMAAPGNFRVVPLSAIL